MTFDDLRQAAERYLSPQSLDRVELHLKDLRPAEQGFRASLLAALRLRWLRLSGAFPEAERIQRVWAEVRQRVPLDGMASTESITQFLGTQPAMREEALRCALDWLKEVGLVAPMQQGDQTLWLRLSDEERADVHALEGYRSGQEQLQRIQWVAEHLEEASMNDWIEALYGFSLQIESTDEERGVFHDL